MSKPLPTIAMTPMPEFGYDPIPLILNGEKVHTLRKRRCHGQKEVTVNGKRTGIVLEFHGWRLMYDYHFLVDDFAYRDGFRQHYKGPRLLLPTTGLRALLKHFYKKIPETMWCNYFRIVQRPEEAPQ